MKKITLSFLLIIAALSSISLFAARGGDYRNDNDRNLYYYNKEAIRDSQPGGTYYYQQNDDGTNYYYNMNRSRYSTEPSRDNILRDAENVRSGYSR